MGLSVVPAQQNVSEQQELVHAFNQFNQLSQQLSRSYAQLENRVIELTTELSEVNRQKADAIQEKESLAARLNELIDFLPGGVIVLNPKGRIQQCNPAAAQLLGEPLLGESWLNVIKRCFVPRLDDGHEVSTIDDKRLAIATGAMQAQGQIVLLTDLTQTRTLQAQLNRQERLASMGKMVSALAHQIRTPLSSAMLYAGHLQNTALPGEKRELFAQKLVQRLHHMEQQVRDMLLFVKGDLALNDTVSVLDLQHSLGAAIEPFMEVNQITCRWQNDCPQKQLRCNQDVLIGAVMNLVNNAIQASQGALTLALKFGCTQDQYLLLSVSDDGPGIAAEDLTECQEAFVTTKSQGIGLGLSVVNIVARAHGGQFQLNCPPQGGTRAVLRLPLITPHTNAKMNRESSQE